ncbi:ABC transporter permease [Mycolicibacterium litorale]|uniref:ABC transporter permease n=1 Tax=Mycolicibacterium litorale TaxID=758802 RepID=UPI0039A1B6AD
MTTVPSAHDVDDVAVPAAPDTQRFAWFPRTTTMYAGLAIVVLATLTSILLPLLAPASDTVVDPKRAYLPPFSAGHLLGTDQVGRDMAVRIALGLRTSFTIAITVIAIAIVVGFLVGLLSGYFGGFLDTVLMRLTDVQMALPFIVLAVAVLSVSEPSFWSLTAVLTLAMWPTYARVVRSATQLEKSADYVRASVAMGARPGRIIRRYLLRSNISAVLVLAVLDVAAVIVYESTLGFLGIGAPPDMPSLGSIMADGKQYILVYWWITVVPGIALIVTTVGLNLVGIALRSRAKSRGVA